MSISKFLLVFPCTDKAPHNNRLNNSLSLSPADGVCACARAYKLSASGYRGNKRVLSRGEHWSGGSSPARVSIDAVRFYQSCRPRPRRHQIILFIERKRSLNRRARYVVYLLLRLVVFLPLAAPTPLLFSTCTAFTTRSFLSLLSPLFLQPILGRDFRRWQNAGTGKQPIGSPREKGTWMERDGGEGTWQNDTSRPPLRYVQAIARPAPLGPGQIINPESWPLSPLNPDKERYLAPSGTKGAVEVVSTTATDPPSPRLLPTFAILVFFLPSCLYSCPPPCLLTNSTFRLSFLFLSPVSPWTRKKDFSLSPRSFFSFRFFPPPLPPFPSTVTTR